MGESHVRDSLLIASETISDLGFKNDSSDWWMWIAIIEFVIILYLFFRKKLDTKYVVKRKLKDDALKEEVDFNNIISSSFHSEKLYNELKVKCHPDRFPNDTELNLVAEGIFQEITKNKNNYKRLLELKSESQQKLNIEFKT